MLVQIFQVYPLAPYGIIYLLGLLALSGVLALIAVLVFNWRDYTLWFVLGIGKLLNLTY